MAYTEEDELKYKSEGMGVPYQDGTTGADGEPKVSVSSRSGYSSSSQTGQSDTTYGSETTSQRQTTGRSLSRKVVNPDAPEATKLDVPELYTPVNYSETDRANMFRDMLRNAEAKRGRAAEANLSEQERLRRRGKYRAWTNLLNSMGQIAGRGYAPVSKEDDKRVLDSYKQLDTLRKEYDTLGDDDVNWIRKAMAQDAAKHYAEQEKMYDTSVKERQDALKFNANAENKNQNSWAGTEKTSDTIVEGVSQTSGQSHTTSQSQRTGSSGGTTTTVSTGGNNNGKSGLHIGRGADVKVTKNGAQQIKSVYNRFIDAYNSNPYETRYVIKVNGKEVVMFNKDLVAIMNKGYKDNQLEELIRDLDAHSAYRVLDANGNPAKDANGNEYLRHGLAEAVRAYAPQQQTVAKPEQPSSQNQDRKPENDWSQYKK